MRYYNPNLYKAREGCSDRIHLISPIQSARTHYNSETGYFECLSNDKYTSPCCKIHPWRWRSGAVIIVYFDTRQKCFNYDFDYDFGPFFECYLWLFGERTRNMLVQCDLYKDLVIECEHFEYQKINIQVMKRCFLEEVPDKIWDRIDQMHFDGLDALNKTLCRKLSLFQIESMYSYELQKQNEVKTEASEITLNTWETIAPRKIRW